MRNYDPKQLRAMFGRPILPTIPMSLDEDLARAGAVGWGDFHRIELCARDAGGQSGTPHALDRAFA